MLFNTSKSGQKAFKDCGWDNVFIACINPSTGSFGYPLPADQFTAVLYHLPSPGHTVSSSHYLGKEKHFKGMRCSPDQDLGHVPSWPTAAGVYSQRDPKQEKRSLMPAQNSQKRSAWISKPWTPTHPEETWSKFIHFSRFCYQFQVNNHLNR